MTTRECGWCGKAMVRGRTEAIHRFAERKFCSRACSGASRKVQGEKFCGGCGAPMRRRDGEHSTNWQKRKTCSCECTSIVIGNAKRQFTAEELAERARVRVRDWRSVEENRIVGNARSRAWALDNHAKVREIKRRYYEANRDLLGEKNKKWMAAHPEYQASKSARRRARKMGAAGRHTAREWLEKCELLGNVCIYCGEAKPLTRDHKIPLSRGGSDYIENIVPACLLCNSRKGGRTAREFFAYLRMGVAA